MRRLADIPLNPPVVRVLCQSKTSSNHIHFYKAPPVPPCPNHGSLMLPGIPDMGASAHFRYVMVAQHPSPAGRPKLVQRPALKLDQTNQSPGPSRPVPNEKSRGARQRNPSGNHDRAFLPTSFIPPSSAAPSAVVIFFPPSLLPWPDSVAGVQLSLLKFGRQPAFFFLISCC